MGPEFIKLILLADRQAINYGNGQDHAVHNIQAKERNRILHSRYILGESVIGGVNNFEYLGNHRRITADKIAHLLYIYVRVIHELLQAMDHLRQCGQYKMLPEKRIFVNFDGGQIVYGFLLRALKIFNCI